MFDTQHELVVIVSTIFCGAVDDVRFRWEMASLPSKYPGEWTLSIVPVVEMSMLAAVFAFELGQELALK